MLLDRLQSMYGAMSHTQHKPQVMLHSAGCVVFLQLLLAFELHTHRCTQLSCLWYVAHLWVSLSSYPSSSPQAPQAASIGA